MTDELVERLRGCANGSTWLFKTHQGDFGICDEAADHIKALTAERDSLLSGHRILNTDGARLQDRAEKAEADNAQLLEACRGLNEIIEGIDGAMRHGTWYDARGTRLKDTPEWVAFYVALNTGKADT